MEVIHEELKSEDDEDEQTFEHHQKCVLKKVKEILQKGFETNKEMSKEKPQSDEEFKEILSQTLTERGKADSSVCYNTFKEELLEMFKSEDQYSTFIACCEYVMESNAAMRDILRLILNVINYVKHTPAYKLSAQLQILPIHRDDFNEMDFEGSFYEDIAKNDPKEQQRNKKKAKKRKAKKASADDETEENKTEEAGGNIPKIEEILQRIDFSSDFTISDHLYPELPNISAVENDIQAKGNEVIEIINEEVFSVVSTFSETCMDQQISVLSRELTYLEKKAAASLAFFEKRESELKASIKDFTGKSEAEAREHQKLESQIKSLEAEIRKFDERKEEMVKRIENYDDNTFVKYKAQWQTTIKRFHELEEEVKEVSCAIRREKQSYSDLSAAAKKEDDALRKEIETLEAAVQRKQAQLGSSKSRYENESEKHGSERQKLVTNIQSSEMLILNATFEREKLNIAKNFSKAQENISSYRKAVEQESDSVRREILEKQLQQWETYKGQVRSSRHVLDKLFSEKVQQLENGGSFYEVCQFDYPQYHPSATSLNDLILPEPAVIQQQEQPAFSHSNYLLPQQPLAPPLHSLPQQIQLTPQRYRMPLNYPGLVQGASAPYNPPTGSQIDHPGSLQDGKGFPATRNAPGDVSISGSHGYAYSGRTLHGTPGYGPYPIGVIPPNYVIQKDTDKVWLPPAYPSVFPPENRVTENTNTSSYSESSRKHSNESLQESFEGVGRIPFRASQDFGGIYPIGVIPPYYVSENGNVWTPPAGFPGDAAKENTSESVFTFPPSDAEMIDSKPSESQ